MTVLPTGTMGPSGVPATGGLSLLVLFVNLTILDHRRLAEVVVGVGGREVGTSWAACQRPCRCAAVLAGRGRAGGLGTPRSRRGRATPLLLLSPVLKPPALVTGVGFTPAMLSVTVTLLSGTLLPVAVTS